MLAVHTILKLVCYVGMIPYSKKLLLANCVDDNANPLAPQDEPPITPTVEQ